MKTGLYLKTPHLTIRALPNLEASNLKSKNITDAVAHRSFLKAVQPDFVHVFKLFFAYVDFFPSSPFCFCFISNSLLLLLLTLFYYSIFAFYILVYYSSIICFLGFFVYISISHCIFLPPPLGIQECVAPPAQRCR